MKRALILSCCLSVAIGLSAADKEPVDYVDCFTGTSNSRWMLGPYAQVPFGMVQIGPDNQGNRWMGGYEYAINSVSAFSHLHAWTMGGLSMTRYRPNGKLLNTEPRLFKIIPEASFYNDR